MKKILCLLIAMLFVSTLSFAKDDCCKKGHKNKGCVEYCDDDGVCSKDNILEVMESVSDLLPEPNPCESNCYSAWTSSGVLSFGNSDPSRIFKADDMRTKADKLEADQRKIDKFKRVLSKCKDS